MRITLTDDDARDLANGKSITTLAEDGTELEVFPPASNEPQNGTWEFKAWVRVPVVNSSADHKTAETQARDLAESFAAEASTGDITVSIEDSEPTFDEGE